MGQHGIRIRRDFSLPDRNKRSVHVGNWSINCQLHLERILIKGCRGRQINHQIFDLTIMFTSDYGHTN